MGGGPYTVGDVKIRLFFRYPIVPSTGIRVGVPEYIRHNGVSLSIPDLKLNPVHEGDDSHACAQSSAVLDDVTVMFVYG